VLFSHLSLSDAEHDSQQDNHMKYRALLRMLSLVLPLSLMAASSRAQEPEGAPSFRAFSGVN
jgi:hypothetical protein